MEKGKMKLSRKYYERLENVFSIEYKDTAGTSNARVHRHDQYELLLCLSDGMFLTVDGEEHEIRKNTLLIFNSVDLHQFGTKEPEGENKRYVLYFDPSYVDYLSSERVSLLECFLFCPFPDGWILELTEAEADDFRRHLDRLLELRDKSEEECYGKELYIQLLLAEMLLKVNSLYRSYHGIANEDHDRNRIYDIVNYIHRNYEEEILLNTLSRRFFINKYALCERFRDVMGTTPSQYIINCRISKAKELLADGYTVEYTCGKAGFNNLSHFSRTFKNKVGMSPKQYQQKNIPRDGSE